MSTFLDPSFSFPNRCVHLTKLSLSHLSVPWTFSDKMLLICCCCCCSCVAGTMGFPLHQSQPFCQVHSTWSSCLDLSFSQRNCLYPLNHFTREDYDSVVLVQISPCFYDAIVRILVNCMLVCFLYYPFMKRRDLGYPIHCSEYLI